MIQGEKKQQQEARQLKVGLFEANVICINPDEEDYKELLGIELKEESKATEYLGTNSDGNTFLRLDVWLEEVKNKDKFKTTFFLENKERENKDFTKKQYINSIGNCSWADDPNNLPKWFMEREYRVAFTGEEELYNFLHFWLGNLDYRKKETTLELEWRKLMKGNVKELRDQLNGEWCTPVGAEAIVITKEKDGETREYQGVYNKEFVPVYSLNHFRLIDYSSSDVLDALAKKKSKELKPHERFVLNITNSQYGCKDYFILKDLRDYNPEDNIVATNKVISSEDSEY